MAVEDIIKTLCERSYYRYTPDTVGTDRPLVICLHPGLSNADDWKNSAQDDVIPGLDGTLDDEADTEKFYILYPTGIAQTPGFGGWNASHGKPLVYASRTYRKDIQLIDNLISEAIADLSIDATKIWLAGFSNGAMLAYSYICADDSFNLQHQSKIEGIVVAAGALLLDSDKCRANIPVSITHIHGTVDVNVPPGGGPILGTDNVIAPSVTVTKAFLEGRGATFERIDLTGSDHAWDNIQTTLLSQESKKFAAILSDRVTA